MVHEIQPVDPATLAACVKDAGLFDRLRAEQAAVLDPAASLDKALPGLCHVLRRLRPELGDTIDLFDPAARSLDVRRLSPNARALSAACVRRVARLLDKVSTKSFEEAYDAGSLAAARVPPDCWDDEDAREWLLDHLATLRQTIEGALLADQALVVVWTGA